MKAYNLEDLKVLFETGAEPPFTCVKDGEEKLIHYFTDGILFFNKSS